MAARSERRVFGGKNRRGCADARRHHQLSNRVEDSSELRVVLGFKLVKRADRSARARESVSSERKPHDLNVHAHGSLATKD